MNAHQPSTTPSDGYDSIHPPVQSAGIPIFGNDASAQRFTAPNLGASAGTAAKFRQFTGKERDAESGLDYFGARYYGSALGRFTSPDKRFADQHVSNPQSWNLYGYTRNNPLRFVDDNGEEVKETANTKYYSVGGATAADAWNNAPSASGIAGGYRGITNYTMSVGDFQFSWKSQTNSSGRTVTDTITTADVNLNVTITLPQWDGYSTASPQEQQQWDQLSSGLAGHENEHKQIAEQGANQLDQSLPGTTATGKGANLPTAQADAKAGLQDKVQQKLQSTTSSTQQQQNHLDDRTKHGTIPDPSKKQPGQN